MRDVGDVHRRGVQRVFERELLGQGMVERDAFGDGPLVEIGVGAQEDPAPGRHPQAFRGAGRRQHDRRALVHRILCDERPGIGLGDEIVSGGDRRKLPRVACGRKLGVGIRRRDLRERREQRAHLRAQLCGREPATVSPQLFEQRIDTQRQVAAMRTLIGGCHPVRRPFVAEIAAQFLAPVELDAVLERVLDRRDRFRPREQCDRRLAAVDFRA